MLTEEKELNRFVQLSSQSISSACESALIITLNGSDVQLAGLNVRLSVYSAEHLQHIKEKCNT